MGLSVHPVASIHLHPRLVNLSYRICRMESPQAKVAKMSDDTCFDEEIAAMKAQLSDDYKERTERLKNLDLFVLDNSLRETTVGQLRGHTLENKRTIFEQVKMVGFENIIVESFNHMNRLGEPFIKELVKRGEDMSMKWAFTEMFDSIDDKGYPIDELPIGLQKCKEFGIKNVIMEIDLMYYSVDYTKFNVEKICEMLVKRFEWIRENLSSDSRVFVNLRDFSPCMISNPSRQFHVVNFLSSMEKRIFGIAYEEGGAELPEQLIVWTKAVRKLMDKCGWTNGHLIVHVHDQFGMKDVVQLECLANGATGIWAGLCEEGAAMGHASSCLTIINLIRIGNKKVLKKFNCQKLRTGSRNVTMATTGAPPHPKQPVCGERALDVVFTLTFLTRDPEHQWTLAEFLGEEPVIRISNMSNPAMILQKLENVFGKNAHFTIEQAEEMQKHMLEDLNNGIKEEYMSNAGLAMLYDRSGGKLTEEMMEVIINQKNLTVKQEHILKEVRKIWDHYDMRDHDRKDDCLEFDAFYDGFMAPHFGCYRCDDARKALSCIDMDSDGKVDWNEFKVYLKWALREYPNIGTAEELITTAFNKGLKPAMHDEILKKDKAKVESCA